MNLSVSQVDTDNMLPLLEACAAGDQSAFGILYEKSSPQLYAILKRILRRDALADEALQETYLKIWRKAKQYESSRATPMAWMGRIARNQAIDMLRQRKIREDNEIDEGGYTEIHQLTDVQTLSVELQAANSELLLLCLGNLEAVRQRCILGSYCEGFSHEELSQQLDTPAGTIKSWIRRSLIALRKCFDEHG